jgi:hypothetical protein
LLDKIIHTNQQKETQKKLRIKAEQDLEVFKTTQSVDAYFTKHMSGHLIKRIDEYLALAPITAFYDNNMEASGVSN